MEISHNTSHRSKEGLIKQLRETTQPKTSLHPFREFWSSSLQYDGTLFNRKSIADELSQNCDPVTQDRPFNVRSIDIDTDAALHQVCL